MLEFVVQKAYARIKMLLVVDCDGAKTKYVVALTVAPAGQPTGIGKIPSVTSPSTAGTTRGARENGVTILNMGETSAHVENPVPAPL